MPKPIHGFSIFTLGIALLTVLSFAKAEELKKPVDATIDFSERNFNFGFMPRGTRVMHTFTVMNKGADTLRIIKVTATCGCTNAPLSNSDIAPGEEAYLDVFFSSGKFKGKVSKKVSLLCNDPNDPYSDIYFTARVDREHPYISTKPAVVEVKKSGGKVGGTYKVKLTNKSSEPRGIKIINYSKPYIEAKLSRDKIGPGKSIDLVIKLRKENKSVINPWYSVTLETNDPQKYRLTVPIRILSE